MLSSLIKATNKAKEKFDNINFELIVTDTNSPENDLKNQRHFEELKI